MEIWFRVHFSPLSNTVYEWVEWMWRMSEQLSGCGESASRVYVDNI